MFVFLGFIGFLITGIDQPRQEIQITMRDGSIRKGMTWETSPMDIGREISKSFVDRMVIAKVHFAFFFALAKDLTIPLG